MSREKYQKRFENLKDELSGFGKLYTCADTGGWRVARTKGHLEKVKSILGEAYFGSRFVSADKGRDTMVLVLVSVSHSCGEGV